MALDQYIKRPEEMVSYLSNYGWHFNKKSCEWATSHMYKNNPIASTKEKFQSVPKETVDEMLKKHGIKLDKNKGWDYVYVWNMGAADFLNSSILDEQHLAMYVKDVIDDVDQTDGFIFRRWYSDMIGSGTPIIWEDLI